MLWNRNDLLRFLFRFLLWKSFGSGSGSDSGSDSCSGSGSGVPVPVPDLLYVAQFFINKKCVQCLAFSMLKAASFSRKLASSFRFLTFCITVYVGSGSAKAKNVAVPAVPVPALITAPMNVRTVPIGRQTANSSRSKETAVNIVVHKRTYIPLGTSVSGQRYK